MKYLYIIYTLTLLISNKSSGQVAPSTLTWNKDSLKIKVAFVNKSDSHIIIHIPDFTNSIIIKQEDSNILSGIPDETYFHSEPFFYYFEHDSSIDLDCTEVLKEFKLLKSKDTFWLEFNISELYNKSSFVIEMRENKDKLPIIFGCTLKFQLWILNKTVKYRFP